METNNKVELQININSKQAIIFLFSIKHEKWIDINDIFSLQNYINKINDGSIYMNIQFDDIIRTVQYYRELFVLSGYKIFIRNGEIDSFRKLNTLPKNIKDCLKGYNKYYSINKENLTLFN